MRGGCSAVAFWKRSRHRATDLRIGKAVERPLPASVIVDGQPLSAFEGESVAAALLAAGVLYLRSSPRLGQPRGVFCAMGVCQECVVEVDGRTVPACLTPIRDGMEIHLRR